MTKQTTQMPTKHIFENMCIDWNPILSCTTISAMIKAVESQAKTTEAKKRADFTHYKDYAEGDWAPKYFGAFIEWYAEQFLNHFGYAYNIHTVQMFEREGSTYEDLGTDGMGKTMRDEKIKGSAVYPRKDAGVYIQVKGALDSSRDHTANDGTRLPNFVMNAMSDAIRQGVAYSSRYIIFTTAKGVHYTLNKMWNNQVTVIGFNDINKLTKHNTQFVNVLRSKVGLPLLALVPKKKDQEALCNMAV